ncbi:hypothetical protein EDC01DRAFT_790654 [Geopyxis carbonaria]|nr:hypothetical protein EDC01DRAFT_790654 [Geopyxis carbonaria]
MLTARLRAHAKQRPTSRPSAVLSQCMQLPLAGSSGHGESKCSNTGPGWWRRTHSPGGMGFMPSGRTVTEGFDEEVEERGSMWKVENVFV